MGWGGRRRGPHRRREGPCGQRCPRQPQAQPAVGKLWTGSAEDLGEEGHRGRSYRKPGSSASPSKEEGPKGGPAGTVWGLRAGGAGEAQKPGGHHARGGATSLHSQGPARSHPPCTQSHCWGRLWGPRGGESSQQVSGAPSGAFLSPMGSGCAPPPPPPRQQPGVELTRGQARGPVQSPPCLPLRFQFLSLSGLCLPHPSRALRTHFQETAPISPTWAPGLGQAGEKRVLLAAHRCRAGPRSPCLGSWFLNVRVVQSVTDGEG